MSRRCCGSGSYGGGCDNCALHAYAMDEVVKIFRDK